MVKCSAPLCGNSSFKKTPEITFHRFPKDDYLKNAWLSNMKRELTWQPKPSSVLCSKHFEVLLLDHSGFRTVLAPSAITTIFDLLYQEENSSKPLLKGPVKRNASGDHLLRNLENLQPSTSVLHYEPSSSLSEPDSIKSMPGYHVLRDLKNIQPSSSSVTPQNILPAVSLSSLSFTHTLLLDHPARAVLSQVQKL